VAKPVGKPFLSLRCISTGKDATDASATASAKLALAFYGMPANTTVKRRFGKATEPAAASAGRSRAGQAFGKISSKSDLQGCSCIKLDCAVAHPGAALADVADADKPRRSWFVSLSPRRRALKAISPRRQGREHAGRRLLGSRPRQVFGLPQDYDLASPDARVARSRARCRVESHLLSRAGNRLEFYNDGCKDAYRQRGRLEGHGRTPFATPRFCLRRGLVVPSLFSAITRWRQRGCERQQHHRHGARQEGERRESHAGADAGTTPTRSSP